MILALLNTFVEHLDAEMMRMYTKLLMGIAMGFILIIYSQWTEEY